MANPGARAGPGLFRGQARYVPSKTMKTTINNCIPYRGGLHRARVRRDGSSGPATIPVESVSFSARATTTRMGLAAARRVQSPMRNQAYWAVLSGAAGHAYGGQRRDDLADPAAVH